MPTLLPDAADHPEILLLRDGRRLAWQAYGDPGGAPIVVFHGFPGSRLQAAFLHDKARAAGVRLIAPDRPGFGLSSPAPRRTMVDGAADIEALVDHLGLRRVDAMGISCGGAHALACAHALPHRIGRVALMAGMGPMDLPTIRHGQLPILTTMFTLARWNRWLASPLLLLDALMFRSDPRRAVQALARLLAAPDRALVQRLPAIAEAFGASLAEAYRQGLAGALREAHLIGRPRGFSLLGIRARVDVHQAAHDRHVPPAMGRYLARTLPHARLHLYDDEGHLSIVWNRFDDAVRLLAT